MFLVRRIRVSLLPIRSLQMVLMCTAAMVPSVFPAVYRFLILAGSRHMPRGSERLKLDRSWVGMMLILAAQSVSELRSRLAVKDFIPLALSRSALQIPHLPSTTRFHRPEESLLRD